MGMRLWDRLKSLVDIIENIADYGTHGHHANKDQAPAKNANHYSRYQYRSDGLSPIKPVDSFDRHNIQNKYIETQD